MQLGKKDIWKTFCRAYNHTITHLIAKTTVINKVLQYLDNAV